MELEKLNAYEIGGLVNAKKISPSEVVSYFLNRIERLNKKVNAFVYLKPEEAFAKAKELEERLSRGENCGAFAGVPFGLKDFLPNKRGWESSCGGIKCLVSVDESDSEFCKAMEKAGGIAIGKTNAPSYGFRGTTDNLLYGATSTPFNTKYNAGGSSGGSAAAVALGLVPISEGGDAGGSIRIPANFCNLFGFKAGVGTIPSVCRPDGWSATHPLCVNGGLTKSVGDSAILLNYMSYENRRDPFSLPKNHDYYKELNSCKKDLKIAFTQDFGIFEVEPKVANAIKQAADKISDLGFCVEDCKFSFRHSANEIGENWCKGITIDCALNLNHLKERGVDLLKEHEDEFPAEFIYWKKVVDNLGIEDMYKYNLVRTDILDQFENAFEKYDLIISPVSCVAAIKNENNHNTKGPSFINGKRVDPLIGWSQTLLANFTGNPAASLPCGLLDENVPIGLQLIAPRHNEMLLLSFAKKFEGSWPWQSFYSHSMGL